jgi:hypothetical protein
VFVDREREVERLRAAWDSDRAELVVVYGRRRVGKTALLRHVFADVPHAYWVATLASDEQLRRGFTEALWRGEQPADAGPGFTYDSWEVAFRAIAELGAGDRRVVVIDEYPHLVSSQPGVSTKLQKVWDERLQHSNLLLVLCGSSVGMMEREVLDYGAALYGRRTGQLRLGPLPFRAAASFVARYGLVDQMATYAILGGIPAYLQQFDDRRPLVDNIERHILDPNGYLYPEPEFLLREELREPRNYFGILQAIAGGRTQLNEIAQAVGLERTAVTRYLATLRELGLVERRVPITEEQPDKSRKGLYYLADHFLRFWFRYVGPRQSVLQSGITAPLARQVAEELPQFIGPAFEEVCSAWLAEQAAADSLPVTIERVGRWWADRAEVDIVGLGPAAVLVAECKWTARPVGASLLADLRRSTAALVERFPGRRVVYALFARSGFTDELQAAAAVDDGIMLVSAERVLAGANT